LGDCEGSVGLHDHSTDRGWGGGSANKRQVIKVWFGNKEAPRCNFRRRGF